jgi:hypothetical protein
MENKDVTMFERIDEEILDLIDLIRARWPNFNSIGAIDKVVHHLYEAYKASGKAADLCDRGHL